MTHPQIDRFSVGWREWRAGIPEGARCVLEVSPSEENQQDRRQLVVSAEQQIEADKVVEVHDLGNTRSLAESYTEVVEDSDRGLNKLVLRLTRELVSPQVFPPVLEGHPGGRGSQVD